MTVTVLVVEDNPANLELVSDLLAGAGFVVRGVATAEEGLEVARAAPPDLVLMDLGLPGLDGFAAVRELRRDPATAHVPVIAVTAFAMVGDELRAREAGFNDYVAKPIDVRTFVDRIRTVLAREGGGRDGT